ncbi:M23 family metallopeptidase [Azospirillum agricola]|uniref:M23 family metallopeptidase n=1 Tax=Azospirillum agricola TaxID=1720247 RepID=UPI000A0F3524|nr:M23 family metallopeptidase [Azospirillum agricola]SMH41066.1 Peptidase family M23 [Azospirillum lipoferum]
MSRVATALAAALLGLTAGSGQAAEPPRFALPLDCPTGNACDVVKLTDLDPGPGLKDYNCGSLLGGENGHSGTDIAIRDQRAMREGVTVRAAAAGTVLRTRDEMEDTGIHGPETREELNARGCGNAVVIGHDDGWQSVYCHLRRGSVAVTPGQNVRTGDPIAQVGMSGLSELPHLHFQVNHGRDVVDPFAGTDRTAACGVGPHPLWTPEALSRLTPYRPAVLRLAGFAEEETDVRTAREGTFTEGRIRLCAPRMVFWSEIIGIKAGDRIALTVEGPDGRPVLNRTVTADRDRAQIFVQATAARPGEAWVVGSYRGTVELTRGRDSYRSRTTGHAVTDGC